MMQRQRSSTTVDIQCARCGKPMMMLSFNYTTLERGFESISLRCQYCKAEETRPWPQATADEGSTQEMTPGETQEVMPGEADPLPQSSEADPPSHSQSSNEVVEVRELATFESSELSDDTPKLSDDTRSPDDSSSNSDPSSGIDDFERLRLRFAGRPVSPPAAPEI